MAFNNKKWALSNVSVSATGEYVNPEEGYQYLKIVDASYDETNARYKISLQCLGGNGTTFGQMYFFSSRDDDSFPPKLTNMKQMGVVASLGEALAGENIGIPNPESIIGGTALADVKLDEYNGKVRPKIWKYEPVPKDIVDSFADIDQFYTEDSEEADETLEEPAE